MKLLKFIHQRMLVQETSETLIFAKKKRSKENDALAFIYCGRQFYKIQINKTRMFHSRRRCTLGGK